MKRLLLLALLLAGAPASAESPKPRFKLQQLAVEGDVLDLVAADLDGHGRKDLIAPFLVGVEPGQKRFLAIFWNGAQGLSSKPDLVLPLEGEAACAFEVANVDDEPGDELLLAGPRGVSARSFKGRVASAPVPLAEEPTLFVEADPDELPQVPMIQPLGAGALALLVPKLGSLAVFVKKPTPGATFVRAALLPVPLETSYSRRRRSLSMGRKGGGFFPSIRANFDFPAVHLADWDGDGLPDLFVAQQDRVSIFRQGLGATFSEKPDAVRDFAIRTPEELRESWSPAAVMVRDIDGDGFADLVVRKQVSKGIASATTTSLVFFGKAGGFAKTPDQVLRHEGASGVEVQLADLTGDGRPDLVVPSVNIGIFAIIRILTSKTLKMNFQVFPFDKEKRRFLEKATAERELRFKISTEGQADSQVVDLFGDYDGDGRPDLVYGTDDEELSIFRGQAGDALFEEDASERITVRAYGEVLAVDLSGAGRADLLLRFPSTKGHRGEIVALLNQGGWTPAK